MGNQRPNHSVSSGIQNGVNNAQSHKVQNYAVNTDWQQKGNEIPIVNSVPGSGNVTKLELRKEIQEKISKPNNHPENGEINKPSQISQPPKALLPNQVSRKTSH